MSGESSPTATAETRKLAAIMFTDMVGFSRQMGAEQCAQHIQAQFRTHNFYSDIVAVVSHGIVKERTVPPREIDRAVARKRRQTASGVTPCPTFVDSTYLLPLGN